MALWKPLSTLWNHTKFRISEFWTCIWFVRSTELARKSGDFILYYTHFEITGDPCNLIGSQQCDLFPNCTIFFALNRILSLAHQTGNEVTKNRILKLTIKLCDFKIGVIKWQLNFVSCNFGLKSYL